MLRGGNKIFISKIKNILKKSINSMIIFLFIIVAKAIYPFVLLRIGKVKDRSLGNFCNDLDLSLYIQSQECITLRIFDFWFFLGPDTSNSAIYKIAKSNLRIISRYIGLTLWNFSASHKFMQIHIVPFFDLQRFSIQPLGVIPSEDFWISYYNSPGLNSYLFFDNEHKETLSRFIDKDSSKVIAMHFRDSMYKTKVLIERGVEKNSVESVAIKSLIRNTSIKKLISSAEYLESIGYAPVRMGKLVEPYSNTEIFPLINYAESQFRNDYSDLHVMQSSSFFIGGFSGLLEVARWLRKPMMLIDIGEVVSFARRVEIISSVVIVLPKVIKRKLDNHVLSFEEILNSGIMAMSLKQFREFINDENCPLELHENNDLDILNSIKLGTRFLEDPNYEPNQSLITDGKLAYSKLYGNVTFMNAPILSPFWPNNRLTEAPASGTKEI
jgi:putative glycosyltransferase (TIGR04372 family)